MKKLIELSPLIVAIVVIISLLCLFLAGAFDAPQKTTITSSTLTEVIKTAKLTTAKYIQHGIAKAQIEGKESGYVLYYAIVRPNVDLAEITYEIDDDKKIVTVVLPEKFTFDVELLEDESHPYYYHPVDPKNWTGKDVSFICKTDAKKKAEGNLQLIQEARQSLINTIKTLLEPLLEQHNYTFAYQIAGGV